MDNLQATIEAIEIPAKGVFWAMISMMSTIVLLCTMLYWTAKPNYDRIDNGLKYRYLKMKGEAIPERIAELEKLFELNRDNAKIRRMKKDVEEYERTILRQATLVKQAHLKVQESEKLNAKAKILQENNLLDILYSKEISLYLQCIFYI